jgi:2-polyprenyl-6-hydroxyphenyl methylase/3-demethylubiquinone-9 3-methyltransferase
MNFTSEINKFTSKADEWWDQNGAFKVLHKINPIRLNFISNAMGEIDDMDSEKATLLDVGCGGGILCESLISIGFQDKNIIGIDAGDKNIQIAKDHSSANDYKINYLNVSLEDFKSNKLFDIVTAFEIIEHVDHYESFITKLCSMVKPKGLIFISTINRTLKSYLEAIVCAEYILKWIPIRTHQWKKFLKPSEIDNILLKNNCEIKKISGIKFDILNQRWYEANTFKTRNIEVNYILVAQKL